MQLIEMKKSPLSCKLHNTPFLKTATIVLIQGLNDRQDVIGTIASVQENLIFKHR